MRLSAISYQQSTGMDGFNGQWSMVDGVLSMVGDGMGMGMQWGHALCADVISNE